MATRIFIKRRSTITKTLQSITSFKKHPVRHLTRSNDNTLCFTYDGEIYTMKEGASSKKLEVRINTDGRNNAEKILPINTGVTQTALSPNGKEIAFIVRGEVICYFCGRRTYKTHYQYADPGKKRKVHS